MREVAVGIVIGLGVGLVVGFADLTQPASIWDVEEPVRSVNASSTSSGSGDVATICAPGYARAQRLPPARYYPIARTVFARDGIPWLERHGWILDHRVPLCLGGGWDMGNLQLQRPAEAAAKDRIEVRACREVCAGRLSLDAARRWFAPD